MRTRTVRALRLGACLVAILVPMFAACEDDEPTGIQLGVIAVTTATSGDSPDPDGYTVTLGEDARPIGTSGTVAFSDLAPGEYSIELGGLAGNCSVAGANPITAEAIGGETVVIGFEITCTTIAGTGDLEITTQTTGIDIDADGYTVVVDGTFSLTIGVNDVVTFTDLVTGSHIAELTEVASNCEVSDPNPITTNIRGARTTRVTFEVTCESI